MTETELLHEFLLICVQTFGIVVGTSLVLAALAVIRSK